MTSSVARHGGEQYKQGKPALTTRGFSSSVPVFLVPFAELLQALPKAQWGLKTIYAGNVLFLEWTADSARASVSDGVDTFLFQDGLMTLQTVRCTIVPKA